MNKLRSIIAFCLLSAYTLVLLHSIVPHIHIGGEHISDNVVSEQGHHHHHHHHHHSHGHDHDNRIKDTANLLNHKSHSNDGFLHALGHLFGELLHIDSGKDHLSYVVTVNNSSQTKPKFISSFAVLLPNGFEPLRIEKEQKTPDYLSFSYERLLSCSLPLRAPPTSC